jgi:hypothetical protein
MKNKPMISMPDNSRRTTPPTISTSGNGLPFPMPMPGPVVGLPDSKGTTEEEYRRAEEFLDELAIRTGGRMFLASTIGNLNNAFRTIASELREFYSIGYYQTEEGKPGTTRTIRVRVNRDNVAVKTRNSYVVPDLKKKKSK